MMEKDQNLYHRNYFHRAPISQYHFSSMSSTSDLDLNKPSSNNVLFEEASVEADRPNRVLSGHRKFPRTLYTGPRSGNLEKHASKIVAKMEQDRTLMEDTPLSEQLRKEALRDLPQCLTMKRCVKMKLTKSVSQKSKRRPIGFLKRVKYKTSISWTQFKTTVGNINYFNLWHGTLKDIEGHFGSGYASYFKFLRWLFVMNFFGAVMSFFMLALPQILFDVSRNNGTRPNTQNFHFEDIFTGKGYFEETLLYYGHYADHSFSLIEHMSFDMPAAYFSVNVILYLFSFIVLAGSVALSYRRTFIETEGGLQNVFASKVLCGWDFGIATNEAAELKCSAIYHELKELLSESEEDKWDRSCLEKFWTYTIQLITHIMVLLVLAAVGWGTWKLLNHYAFEKHESLLATIVVNLAITILPIIFNFLSKYEDYKNPRTTLYITLFRTYLLGCVIIGAILSFWLNKAWTIKCWQNYVVSEMYRLILFDFIIYVFMTTVIETIYCLIQKLRGVDCKYEFDIARHTLQIIYNQGLFWVGCFYSPIISVMITLKMLIIWYVRELNVRKLCRPPRKTWRAAQAQTWFMMMIFVSILLIIAVHGYTLKSIPASDCGPFKNYNYTYEILTQNMANLQANQKFWEIVTYITRPGSIALIMIALCILVYYLREQALAQQEKVQMLREMLIWMAKDKKFLMQWYTNVTNGDYKYNRLDSRIMDPRDLLTQQYDGDDCNQDYHPTVSDEEFNSRFNKYS